MARWIGDQSKEALRRRDAEAQGGGALECIYCAVVLHIGAHNSDLAAASIDHLTPRSKGGELKAWDNLVCCCASCNSKRQDTDLSIWLATLPNGAEVATKITARLALNGERGRYMAEARGLGLYDGSKPKKKGVKP